VTTEGLKVLVVDDDREFLDSIAGELVSRGLFVVPTASSSESLEVLKREQLDLALIDKSLGFECGFDLIHKIRHHAVYGSLPIIVITGELNDQIKHEAIHIGADDLLEKPFQLQDLELKIKSLMRRSRSYLWKESILRLQGIEIDLVQHKITIGDEVIELTRTEYKLFTELALKRGEVISREHVAQKFLSLKNQSPRTIDVHMTSLRKKLGIYGPCIKTVRGRGYSFQLSAD
jgi:DNA-binding response OmpR family regulator